MHIPITKFEIMLRKRDRCEIDKSYLFLESVSEGKDFYSIRLVCKLCGRAYHYNRTTAERTELHG